MLSAAQFTQNLAQVWNHAGSRSFNTGSRLRWVLMPAHYCAHHAAHRRV